jgi:8-oxo-dGTP pyrophosphatase MutT (NUDIX family)
MIYRKSQGWKIVALLTLSMVCMRSAEAVREEGVSKIEVLVSTYCYRINRVRGPEILLLKRTPQRSSNPSLWECGGGTVHANESFEAAARRQLQEETGMTASRWKTLECFEVEISPGEIVPGIAFSCKANPDAQVRIDPREHAEYRWVTIGEIEDLPLVSMQMRRSIVKLLMTHDKFFSSGEVSPSGD